MSSKTNAARIFDQYSVAYELIHYTSSNAFLSAVEVANEIGVDVAIIYKTLVLKTSNNQNIVAVIPGNEELNLKKIAQASSSKSCDLIPQNDLLKITGYIKGGCSPVGMKKILDTYVDQTALSKDKIIISAGKRGVQIKLNPQDIAKVIKVTFADII